MPATKSQKERRKRRWERSIAQIFVDRICPHGCELRDLSPPEPDFSIFEDVGLEVTEIHVHEGQALAGNGSRLRQAQAQRDQFLRDAEDHFLTTYGRALAIDIIGLNDIRKYNTPIDFSNLVAGAIDRCGPFGWGPHRYVLETGLSLMVREKMVPSDCWKDISGRVGWVVMDGTQYVQSAIDEKAEKLSGYLSGNLKSCCLLVVANHMRSYGMISRPDITKLDLKGFSEVYFFPYPDADKIVCASARRAG